MTKTTIFLAATLLAAGPVFADAHSMAMTDFDSDSDGMLSDMEFGEAEGGMRFGDYDADGDGNVTTEEFSAGEFRRYDRNRDMSVDADEYGTFEMDRDAMNMEEDA